MVGRVVLGKKILCTHRACADRVPQKHALGTRVEGEPRRGVELRTYLMEGISWYINPFLSNVFLSMLPEIT